MPKYLTIHHETAVDRLLLESRWTEISMDSRAEWIMTAFNLEQGLTLVRVGLPPILRP